MDFNKNCIVVFGERKQRGPDFMEHGVHYQHLPQFSLLA